MVDMQMRAQHGVDAVGGKTGRGQLLQERIAAVVPGRHVAALLVVAEPGVDDDAVLRRFHQQRMDRHFQAAVLIGEMRDQPGQALDLLRPASGRMKRVLPTVSSSTTLGDF